MTVEPKIIDVRIVDLFLSVPRPFLSALLLRLVCIVINRTLNFQNPNIKSASELTKTMLQSTDCTMATILQPTEMTGQERALHEAAKSNNVERIERLLVNRVNVNCTNSLGRTAMHWAAACGHHATLDILAQSGADIHCRDKYGMLPVLWAAWFGHLDALRTLINMGANAHACNKQGMNILHCAAENNHVQIIGFIAESVENLKRDDVEKRSRTAVHLAAYAGHVEATQKLADIQCDLHKLDQMGRTPLHSAALGGSYDTLETLLLAGIPVTDTDLDGHTPLHLAAEEGHTDLIPLLLKHGADVNCQTHKQMTPLHLSAMQGHTTIVDLILEYGCDVCIQNCQGNTALHLSCLHNQSDIVQTLIDANCALNIYNKRYQTPLHVAVETDRTEIVEILLRSGADIEARDKAGRTALQMGSRGSHVVIVDMVIKADRYRSMIKRLEATGDLDHELDEELVCLRRPLHHSSDLLKEVLWLLATKELRPLDWKKLATFWKFKQDHVLAIEHEYTGAQSFREHGFRLLMIWLCGIRKDENPVRILFEALVAIGRRATAEQVRRKVSSDPDKCGYGNLCIIT